MFKLLIDFLGDAAFALGKSTLGHTGIAQKKSDMPMSVCPDRREPSPEYRVYERVAFR